ncbi:MAG: YiiD C-terminal domain-containing protein [Ktedonobacteraceae bacterium]
MHITDKDIQSLLRALQQTLSQEIPITEHLGIAVEGYDGKCLTLIAPLEQNVNHKQTAFGGSLNALLTLAGWGLLWLLLKEHNLEAEIVIQESVISYLLPVTRDFSACCRQPGPAAIAAFENTLRKKGKARLELYAEIYEAGALATTFKGRYVALLHQ